MRGGSAPQRSHAPYCTPGAYSRQRLPDVYSALLSCAQVALATLHILQNHYPERLGKAVSYLPPTIFDLLYRVGGV